MNADGYEDLFVTSPEPGNQVTTLWYGPLSMSGATVSASNADATFNIGYGGVAPAGDVNADGYDDIWLGGETTYLFHGTP